MCLLGFKCWKHIANVVFLCKPDLPRSVEEAEVTLKTVILCFSSETYVCARTERDGGMPRLAEMIGTATFFSETFTGTMERCVHSHIPGDSISQTSSCILHILNYVCEDVIA